MTWLSKVWYWGSTFRLQALVNLEKSKVSGNENQYTAIEAHALNS